MTRRNWSLHGVAAVATVAVVLLALVGIAAFAQEPTETVTRYFVVRHAEKCPHTEKADADDNHLSAEGLERADALATRLSKEKIELVFVSDKRRTKQTAAPTEIEFHLTHQRPEDASDKTDDLIAKLEGVSGRSVLVVRHSHEFPKIVTRLLGREPTAEEGGPIAENLGGKYGDLFVVTKRVSPGGTTTGLHRDRFGK
jgi:phosphohistidine phosphatase SixA